MGLASSPSASMGKCTAINADFPWRSRRTPTQTTIVSRLCKSSLLRLRNVAPQSLRNSPPGELVRRGRLFGTFAQACTDQICLPPADLDLPERQFAPFRPSGRFSSDHRMELRDPIGNGPGCIVQMDDVDKLAVPLIGKPTAVWSMSYFPSGFSFTCSPSPEAP